MKKFVIVFALICSSANALERSGFAMVSGVGFRQDHVLWKNHEVYPCLRMFDWMGGADVNMAGIRVQAMGDLGWFSHQLMRQKGQFEFISKGRVSTCDARLGYQIDLVQKLWSFFPLGGWFQNQLTLRRTDPIPPVPTNLSKFRQKWSGLTAGGDAIWQFAPVALLDMNYVYGWLKLCQSSEESTIHSQAHGHIARCQLSMQLSKNCSFNVEGRYFYLFAEMASLNSFSAFLELAFQI